jgi:hypothetical protein
MDLTVEQAACARILRLVGRAVPARPKLPVLGRARDGSLTAQ